METPHVVRCLVLLALLLGASTASVAQSAGDTSGGRRVDFELTAFRDTLFVAVDGALRARFDDENHVWYSTEGGLVHVDPANATRELFTKVEGLPSSYALGMDVSGRKVYVGTDLGLGIVDRVTSAVTAVTPLNSALPDQIVQDVLVVGDEIWLGTRFYGVAVWNSTRSFEDPAAWTLKNTSTTTDFAKPVRRITSSAAAVWVATEGDGLWRFDRASRTWNVTVKADGLPANEVTSAAERDGALWVGTPRGLAVREANGQWRTYNASNSAIPDNRVTDVDVLPTVNGTLDVFASTHKGLWQLEPETGKNGTRAQGFGILGAHIFDNEFAPNQGWLFATTRGVSMLRNGAWSYFSTGPTDGPTWGPHTFGFTSASVGDGRGFLWFGSLRGLSAYHVPSNGVPGYWQNFGEWQNYPGSVVNWIDTDSNITWFGTNQGTYGFEHETGRWIPKLATGSRNLVYGIEADAGELWVALFGDGLRMENLTTGVVRSWDFQTPLNALPDQYLTDVRADGNTIWLGASIGVIRMDRATGTIRGTYTQADGIPGNGVIFRLEPDGAIVWLGTADGGVARFDVGSGRVTRVWNQTTESNFPAGQVRSLHREGGRLWVGTTEGLVQIDINSGAVRAWNQANSGLVQNFVNGITSAQGLLYLATLSGVQRYDIVANRFLPLHDGPGVVRVDAAESALGPTRVSVRIDAPRDGTAVTGLTQVRGTALAFGGRVDRVEVRIGSGDFAPASGTESWTFDWDASTLPPNEPVAIAVRAFAGELAGQTEIAVTPVAPPQTPLAIEEVPSDVDAYANRPLRVIARVAGDEPLTAALFYRPPATSNFVRVDLARQGNLFTGTIPAREMREGEMHYYLEAYSGLLYASAAGDATAPTALTVLPAPRLAVAIDAPVLVEATAGEETEFTLNVTNAGTEPATFTVQAAGLRSAWALVPPDDLDLEPGQTRAVNVRLLVPEAAFADNTTLTFEARDSNGQADPASASVPVRIHASPNASVAPTRDPRDSLIPVAPVPLALALILALALVRRRRA